MNLLIVYKLMVLMHQGVSGYLITEQIKTVQCVLYNMFYDQQCSYCILSGCDLILLMVVKVDCRLGFLFLQIQYFLPSSLKSCGLMTI